MQLERERGFGNEYSGEQVSNTWVTCLRVVYYGSEDNRNPHYFPTRRSSDLSHRNWRVEALSPSSSLIRCGRRRTRRLASRRSEEHTSELQSQFHLVCRLLLEKKNGRGSESGVEPCLTRASRTREALWSGVAR